MKILYCTQSDSLHLFHALNSELVNGLDIERAGFTLADSSGYIRWCEGNPNFENEGHLLLKEWEITSDRVRAPDMEKLAKYEKQLGGQAGLFGAIIADRRLFMGPDCTYTQDYRRRFSDDQILRILQRGLEDMERIFDDLQPDVVVSFICVTMLDYLAYLFARARGVKVLNLRPTRVGDRVSFSCVLNDPSPELSAAVKRLAEGGDTEYRKTAQDYIRRVREEHGRYEGVVRPSDKPALKANLPRHLVMGGLFKLAGKYLKYRKSVVATDNHVPDPLRYMMFTGLINPYRATKVRKALKNVYVSEADLKKLRYAFYPLHTEPEVSLLVYGRPYVNQIEVIRMLAMSLPVDMVLVVKEHPWMVGKRSKSAYRKIMAIPRVRIANPKLDARTLIQQSDLVAVITGSVALEAAMLDKPVITFGDCPYNLLPDTMVRRCEDPRHLQITVQKAMQDYRSDDTALENYIAGVFETSASINLYSVLLGKRNVHMERDSSYANESRRLAEYVAGLLCNEQACDISVSGAARW